MLKKLFAWKYSGAVVLLFYGFGAICWRVAVHWRNSRALFMLAGLFYAVALLASLAWVWWSPLFRTDPVAYQRIQAERRARGLPPKKGKKKLRRNTSFGFAIIFLVAVTLLAGSYKAPSPRHVSRGRLEVYLSDGVETQAARAPLMDRTFHSRDLVFSMVNVPTKDIRVHRADDWVPIEVVVRNMGVTDVKNARLEIVSDAPIKPADAAWTALSSNELAANAGEIEPYSRTARPRIFKVNVSIPKPRAKVGLYVTIAGENLAPSAAVENLHFVENEAIDAPSTMNRARPSGPAAR